jgi:glutaredoxin-like protein NrdH
VVVVGAASWSGFRPDRIKAVAMARATVPASSTDELGANS